MPTPVACTAYLGSDAGRGWSETIHLNVASPTPNLVPILSSYLGLMLNFRRPMLGADRYIKGLKVSAPTPTGAIASVPYRFSPYSYPTTKRDGCAPSSAVRCQMGEATGTLFAPHYLGGFWDDVERNEQLDFTTAAGVAWKSLLDAYITNMLAGGYGWMAQDANNTRRGLVTGYISNPDGTITFTLDVESGPPLGDAPVPTNMRIARLNGSDSPLNTTMLVSVTGANTVKTLKRQAAGPFVTSGTFVMAEQAFTAYTGILYAALARKAEGRPTILSPARRKAAARF